MSEADVSVFCGSCGQSLNEDPGQPSENQRPCPHCGSSQRTINVSVQEKITVKEKFRLKDKQEGKKKPSLDQTHGDDLQHQTGKWMKLSRVIDRDNDLYHETVTNPETGEVVHECKEPLSEHRGHGAAKKKKGN